MRELLFDLYIRITMMTSEEILAAVIVVVLLGAGAVTIAKA
jgi:hypothetical protein